MIAAGSVKYKPLSQAAKKRILKYDADCGFGPGGTMANRNRFYTYLTQSGSDVQVRTIAVKARKRDKIPCLKEVVRASVDDPWMQLLDIVYMGMSGYVADWSPQGFYEPQYCTYRGKWQDEPYGIRCMWKIHAPVINPELLKRTKRFRWAAWEHSAGHILDYLKVYRDHPEVEFFSKAGLGRLATCVSVVRKMKKDKNFVHFFRQNLNDIRDGYYGVDAIMKAYSKGLSLVDAQGEISARREFYRLPAEANPIKALRYADKHKIGHYEYAKYLRDCKTLGLDLDDTKVSFPKNFNARMRFVADKMAVIERKENAIKFAEMNRQLEAVAKKLASKLPARSRSSLYVVCPRSVQDFIDEGRGMKNCLEEYAAKVARGETLVIFVRKKQEPQKCFVAAAYDPKRKIVTQCYGVKNTRPASNVSKFVNRVFDGIKPIRTHIAA